MSALPITGQLLGTFKPSKRFSSKHGTRITSVDFDDTGDWCVTAGDDETIQLYDCKRGKLFVGVSTVDTQALEDAIL
jgi:COMPASS component SWD2